MADASAAAGAPPRPAPAPAAPPAPRVGEVFVAGCVAHSMAGRKDGPASGGDGVPETNLYSFAHFKALSGKRIARVVAAPAACHFAALDADGGAYVWGRNERGQLGTGDVVNRYRPVKVELPAGAGPVIDVALGKGHTLLVTADGAVFAAGDNKAGACGVGKEAAFQGGTLLKWTRAPLPDGKKATAAAAGAEFSIVLASGTVYAAGSQQYGQCGSGTNGETIVSAGRLAWKELISFRPLVGAISSQTVTAVAAGAQHGVALTAEGIPYTWGSGAYGRLGHGVPADISVAAPVKFFEPERLRVGRIFCGGSVTYVLTRTGPNPLLYHFGITKKSGEATMKPAYVSDILSMTTRAVAVGAASTILAADTSVVAWGPAPTYGELGFGAETKSSTKPKLVDDFEGTHAIDVAMGYATSFVLIDVASESAAAAHGAKLLADKKFVVYDPAEPAAGAGAAAAAKRKAEEAPAKAAPKAKKAK